MTMDFWQERKGNGLRLLGKNSDDTIVVRNVTKTLLKTHMIKKTLKMKNKKLKEAVDNFFLKTNL